MKAIPSYTDVKQLQQIMRNAKTAGREDIYNEAFHRRCQLEGVDYDDPLEREFYATLAAYEELLTEKNGKKTPANYTRRALRNKGVEACLESWALSPTETDGFKTLVARGLIALTGEHLVTKYPERFSPVAVDAAERRIARYK